MRNTIVTLFNKNNITIVKTNEYNIHCQEPYMYYTKVGADKGYSYIYNSNKAKNGLLKKHGKDIVSVRLKSPLGFYYTKKIDNRINSCSSNNIIKDEEDKSYSKNMWYIRFDNATYIIIYYTSYHGTNISIDTRPWDLFHNTFDDHYVTDLKSLLDSIFGNIKQYKKVNVYKLKDYKYTLSDNQVGELKSILYKDLFGNSEGPKFMTNNEKILAHGFDLKESFRGPVKIKK